jgi:hypothetical protein
MASFEARRFFRGFLMQIFIFINFVTKTWVGIRIRNRFEIRKRIFLLFVGVTRGNQWPLRHEEEEEQEMGDDPSVAVRGPVAAPHKRSASRKLLTSGPLV